MDDSVIASLQLTIRSDEGQTLETLAKETLYGGKFILSTQLRKPIILSYYPNDTATQFLKKFTLVTLCDASIYRGNSIRPV